MGDQEMQFADPAWRPPQQGSIDTRGQQPNVAQPLNNDTFKQSQQQDEPYAHTFSYTEGYRAQPASSIPSISNIPLRTRRQRRYLSPWLWIVLALIIFSLMSGALSMNAQRYSSFPRTDIFRHDHFQPFAQQFPVSIHPTIVVTDTVGSITVRTGGPDGEVIVQSDQPDQFGSKLLNTTNSGNGTLKITVNDNDPSTEVNLDVTVANEADIVLKTDAGDINVSGVNGEMNLTSNSGDITLSQVSLARNSSIVTNSGNITFAGAINPNAAYLFQAQSGSVDLTFPSDASFHADITTNSGSIYSDFPEVSPSPSDANAAHGDVGNPPYANMTIKTDSGSIDLHKEP